ncbi:uncharacterized protein P174DRAFT_239581 [Aspergillus novofumigatus IBT 16806]|uniref:Uncharacterized protein n=1 Tax=Aspergillus novofumigatus (strain IBT 16806) TaxID=1392255 RepID=A0A2I1C1K5_ASPN1|nr:uncharacterized protein P174DRAFT_239581 [Aspergillus novofumigatus IBT 16806]PKX91502.1 hypothetical protein P174DRAFT_239581 [Aspergillus novofumigatus IBT 16806]
MRKTYVIYQQRNTSLGLRKTSTSLIFLQSIPDVYHLTAPQVQTLKELCSTFCPKEPC